PAKGNPIVTATFSGLAPLQQGHTIDEVVIPQPAALAFTTPARQVTPAACSEPLTVAFSDDGGAPFTLLTQNIVALTSSSGSLQFFAGDGCGGAPLTSVVAPVGVGEVSFRFK